MTMKMREEASFVLHVSEVDDKNTAARSEDTAHFVGTLLTRSTRQMMEHHRAQHGIESRIGEWQRFGGGVLE